MQARRTLVEARREAGLSQRELARRSRVPQAAISRIEHGLVSPRTETMDRLLRACGKDLQLVDRPGMGLDRTSIRSLLERSPGDRLRLAAIESRNLDRLLSVATRR